MDDSREFYNQAQSERDSLKNDEDELMNVQRKILMEEKKCNESRDLKNMDAALESQDLKQAMLNMQSKYIALLEQNVKKVNTTSERSVVPSYDLISDTDLLSDDN